MSQFPIFADSPDGGAVCGMVFIAFIAVVLGVAFLSTLIRAARRTWKDTFMD